MNEYPSDWETIELGHAFAVRRGDSSLTKSAYRKTGFTAFSASGADGFVEECQNEGEGIVISSVGAQCGKIFRASGQWTAINNTIAITEKDASHSIDYLYQILSRQDTLLPEGGAQPFISQKEVVGTTLRVPPLPEQKKIAEILSGIDQAIEKSIAALGKISTLSKAVLEAANHQYAKEDTVALRDVCELITKGATPTTYGHELTTNRFFDSVSFLGGGNASPEGRFVYGSERFCSQEATRSLRRSNLKEGDSLVTIVGYVGNTCIIPKEILPANINQNVALVRADLSRLHHQYLHLFLRTDGGKQLAQIATTQAQPSVSLKQVGDLEIHLPSIEEQLHAIKQADSFFKKETQLEGKIESLRLLKTAVASDLLSGRKRVGV